MNMPKKKIKDTSTLQIEKMIKKVKSVFLDTIVREWINTPQKEWLNKTPLQLIKEGEGEQFLLALQKSEEEFKKEKSE